jgi:hypothetical protein
LCDPLDNHSYFLDSSNQSELRPNASGLARRRQLLTRNLGAIAKGDRLEHARLVRCGKLDTLQIGCVD